MPAFDLLLQNPAYGLCSCKHTRAHSSRFLSVLEVGIPLGETLLGSHLLLSLSIPPRVATVRLSPHKCTWLTHLCSLTLAPRRLLQAALEHVASSLLHYRHTHALKEQEAALFRAATRTALDVMLPYLAAAFARIFPGGSSSRALHAPRLFFS